MLEEGGVKVSKKFWGEGGEDSLFDGTSERISGRPKSEKNLFISMERIGHGR